MRARAVILAAGHSTRMGHPKALTQLDGEAALARIVHACEAAGLARPLVVMGAHHEVVRAALPHLDVEWLRNPAPDGGRTGSLQVALREHARDLLVWPVDHPLASAETARALLAADGAWVVPTFDGRGGHPILLRAEALAAVAAAPADAPLRDLLRAAGFDARRVPVEDEGILANLDTPDAVARSRASGQGQGI